MSRKRQSGDFDRVPEFPRRAAAALSGAVRGEPAEWPPKLADDERQVIEAHGMLPLVMRLSGSIAREDAIGDAALETLRLLDLQEVLRVLGERGVMPLILKGTALAYSVYPQPEMRPRVDVDLLVDRGDFAAAAEAFRSLGFEAPATSGDVLGYRQQSFARKDAFGLRHVYDVHLDITNNALTARALEYGELRVRSEVLPAIAPDARGLCAADALLYACVHRAVHHHGSERLIWLYDVHLLRERMSEEEHRDFWRRAAARQLVAISRSAIDLAERWFGVRPHQGATDYLDRETLERREESAAFLRSGRRHADVLAGDLAALTWRERLQRLRQLAFPPPSYVLERAGTKRRVLLPWLYTIRAARGFTRLFRRVNG